MGREIGEAVRRGKEGGGRQCAVVGVSLTVMPSMGCSWRTLISFISFIITEGANDSADMMREAGEEEEAAGKAEATESPGS